MAGKRSPSDENSLAWASSQGTVIRFALKGGTSCGFLDGGQIEIYSNTVGRLIRSLLTAKTALFADSEQGTDNWAVIALLIEACKLNGVDPQVWLDDMLSCRAAGHAASALN